MSCHRLSAMNPCGTLHIVVSSALILACQCAKGDETVPVVQCQVDRTVQGLTREEREAVAKSNVEFNPLVSEYLSRWGPPKEEPTWPDTRNSVDVDWPQAKRMVYSGLVTTAIQNHALHVWIVSVSGRSYHAIEPRVDEVFHAVAVVDPCHRYVRQISE